MLNDAIYLLATIWFSCSNIPCGTKTRKCLYQLHFIPKKVLFWIILANIACYNYSIQSHQKFHNLSLGKLHYRIYLNTLWNILWLFDVLPLAITLPISKDFINHSMYLELLDITLKNLPCHLTVLRVQTWIDLGQTVKYR